MVEIPYKKVTASAAATAAADGKKGKNIWIPVFTYLNTTFVKARENLCIVMHLSFVIQTCLNSSETCDCTCDSDSPCTLRTAANWWESPSQVQSQVSENRVLERGSQIIQNTIQRFLWFWSPQGKSERDIRHSLLSCDQLSSATEVTWQTSWEYHCKGWTEKGHRLSKKVFRWCNIWLGSVKRANIGVELQPEFLSAA